MQKRNPPAGLLAFLFILSVALSTTVTIRAAERFSDGCEAAGTSNTCSTGQDWESVWCDNDSCGGCWTFAADALFLSRSAPESLDLIFADVAGNPGPPIFNARSLDDDFAIGPRVSLIRDLCGCDEWELNVFGFDGWSSVASVNGPIQVAFPGFIQAFGPGTGTFTNTSNLFSAEFNFRRQTRDWLTVLAGVRWVEVGDELLFQFTPPGGPTANMYTIDTNNHLYGGQIGALAQLSNYGPWNFDGWVKAGIFYNSADQSTDVFFPAVGSIGDRDNETSFLGDVALIATRPITDRLSLRLGYQLLWIEGLALASDQLNGVNDVTVPIAVLDTHSGIFYHGAFAGAEFLW